MSEDLQQHIDREVQKRVARERRELNSQIDDLKTTLNQCKEQLIQQNAIINRLGSEPFAFGTLLKVHNFVDPAIFKTNDEVYVVDKTSENYMSAGRIVSSDPVVNDDGYVVVSLIKEGITLPFGIGVEGKASAQVRLTTKKDGSFAVVQSDGKPWEVQGAPDLDLRVGEPVKIKPDNKAIVDRGYELSPGPICHVAGILNESSLEIVYKGDKLYVNNPNRLKLEEGDRVVVDHSLFSVIKKLPSENNNRYKLQTEAIIDWEDIGGLENAKQDLKDALELPFLHPDIYSHYQIGAMRGALLYGPPGCGKTLLARAAASSLAKIRGKDAVETGYIYIKSPEILSKWVGETEREIRVLFERARKHYREHGYKAILAFDEADAIMPQRGTRRSSDISDTIVPMFLGEMDGIDSKQTEENPIVLLLTNRADILDPAVTRPGRISNHIKVERPDVNTAVDILQIHCKNIPFVDPSRKEMTLAVAAGAVFAKTKLLYRVNNEYDFTLGDCVNGAMLEKIANDAKLNALHRDIDNKTVTGVTVDDFTIAVQKLYREQRGVNHTFDLWDFAEKKGIQSSTMQTERCFGAG